jgi:hypothetical protein
MSAQIVWDAVRANSSFKRVSLGRDVLSADPLNLTNTHSFKASGIAQPKALGVVAVSRKGKKSNKVTTRYAIVAKVVGAASKPAKSVTHSFLGKTLKKVAKSVTTVTKGNNSYRPDLYNAALARASRLRKVKA